MLNCNVQPKVYCPNMAKYTRRRIINDPLKWAVGHHNRRHSFDEVPPSPLYTCSFTLESGLKKVVFVYFLTDFVQFISEHFFVNKLKLPLEYDYHYVMYLGHYSI